MVKNENLYNKYIKFKILFWLLVLVCSIIFMDVYTKKEIMNRMYLYEEYPLASFLNLFYCQNYGIAFSILSDGKYWQYWSVIIFSIFVIIFILVTVYYNYSNISKSIAYAFIVGGALSNLFDRIYNGFVVDFIDFHITNFHFATFNFADICILSGIILLILKKF
ncbi:signal peptidase II [Candidatus Pantoea edessiphila]|uniref:Lipoprotein signal peptidase n=1 Tax=Candidatus Pantoea edessiphila TaxID=2044610 RepID=A0A2P5SY43_9GAMM|nr:signal peptidase II [Candidatus Pantoea edessiphila]MBK4775611.1 signal peptidase II [Pantoea sp. Edef]PPI87259.1 signal peptidase II [Candidatus Pantoea edessiphila]